MLLQAPDDRIDVDGRLYVAAEHPDVDGHHTLR